MENKTSKPASQTGRYLKYAIGEILLVVIGILIALQINNWNERRNLENELNGIYERIIRDLENDITELQTRREFWESREYLFRKVINDSITPDLLDQGLSRLLTRSPKTNLNKTGIQQLKAFNSKDELALRLIEAYDLMENISIIKMENEMSQRAKILVSGFKDKYNWYPEYMSKTIMKDNSSQPLQDYFLKSREYKHHVIDRNQLIFNNYVRNLDNVIPLLQNFRNELKKRTDSNYSIPTREQLEAYTGIYTATRKIGADFGPDVGDVLKMEALDHTLLVNRNQDHTGELLHNDGDTYIWDNVNNKQFFIFKRDETQRVNRLELIVNSRQMQSTIYFERQ